MEPSTRSRDGDFVEFLNTGVVIFRPGRPAYFVPYPGSGLPDHFSPFPAVR